MVNYADIVAAYQEAFGMSWLQSLLSMFQGVFKMADQNYQEVDEELILEILTYDRTDLERYVAEDFDCEVSIETSYALGLFFADGSCGLRGGNYAGAWWRIVGWKKDCLERAQKALEIQYPHMVFPLRVYDSYKSGYVVSSSPFKDKERKKTLYCLEAAPKVRANDGTRGEFIERFRNTNYNQWGEKKVPAGILESPSISKRAFLQGVFDGDGTPVKSKNPFRGTISCHGIMQTTELMDLMHDCGWKFNFGRDNGDENYWITFNSSHEKLALVPACDDFAFRLMGVFHQDRRTAAMPIFITWVSWDEPDYGLVGHAVLSFYSKGKVYIIEPQTDEVYEVPFYWNLDMICG